MFPCGRGINGLRASSDKLQMFRLRRSALKIIPIIPGQWWTKLVWSKLHFPASLLKLELLSRGNASEMGKLACDSTNYPSKLLHKQVGLVCWVWVVFLIIFTILDLSGYSHLCVEAARVPHCWGSYFQENNNIKTSSTKEKVKRHASKKQGGKKFGFLGFSSCTPSHVLVWGQLKWLKAIPSLNCVLNTTSFPVLCKCCQ